MNTLHVDMGPRTYFDVPVRDHRTLGERIQRVPSIQFGRKDENQMNPKINIADVDQAHQVVLETLIPFYAGIYKRFVAEGLSPAVALMLTTAYIQRPLSPAPPT